jgi:hypothetical protein
MQRMQNKAQQKLNKADENCEIKQQFLWAVTLYFCNWKTTKDIFLWWRHNKLLKKNKGQGFYIFYISKTVGFYNIVTLDWVWGFVWSVYKLSVKLEKLLQKKNQFGC